MSPGKEAAEDSVDYLLVPDDATLDFRLDLPVDAAELLGIRLYLVNCHFSSSEYPA